MATDPKLMDEGVKEIVAAPDAGCWLDVPFDALVRPMQPERDRAARNKRTRDARALEL
jgi:hypothetical protein